MMKRSAPWVLLVLLLAAWFQLNSSDRAAPEWIARALEIDARSPSQNHSSPTQPTEVEESASHGRVPLEDRAERKTAKPRSSATKARTLRGNLILTDLDHHEWVDLDARFQLGVWRGGRREGHRINVRSGLWSIELADYETIDKFSTLQVVLDSSPRLTYLGFPVRLDEPDYKWGPPPDEWMSLRATMRPHSVLHVVDARTGLDLQEVRVAVPPESSRFSEDFPGTDFKEYLRAEDVPSPLVTASLLRTQDPGESVTLHVGAPGYAWKRISLRPKSKVYPTVELSPGGLLAVNVIGVSEESKPTLFVGLKGSGSVLGKAEVESDGVLEFDGLPPGETDVTAYVGPDSARPLKLGEAMATVATGRQTTVAIHLVSPPAVLTASAGGTLYLAEMWERNHWRGHTVNLEFLGTPLGGFPQSRPVRLLRSPEVKAGYNAYSWRAEDLLTGPYQLTSESLDILPIPFDLPAGGRSDFVHTIAPPAECTVKCYDADSGKLVRDVTVTWSLSQGKTSAERRSRHPQYNSERGGFVLQAPRTQIDIMVGRMHDTYQRHRESVDLSTGDRVVSITLQRMGTLEVHLLSTEGPVPFPPGRGLGLQAPDGSPADHEQHANRTTRTLKALPGQYILTFPKLPGFKRPEPQRIDFTRDPDLRFDILLKRE